MAYLLLGITVFFVPHIFSSLTNARATLIARLGNKPYKIGYAILSFLGIGLIVMGLGEVQVTQLYQPAEGAKFITSILMFIAIASYLSFAVPTNLRRFTAHPMMWGVLIWAVAHLLANGNLDSVILFVSFLMYSIYVMVTGNKRGARPSTQAIPWKRDLTKVFVVIGIFALMIYFHEYFTGTAIIPKG